MSCSHPTLSTLYNIPFSTLLSLPDDMVWFEPPTVCRWETPDETKISERIENKRSESVHPPDHTSSNVSAERKPIKAIDDFDLFNIPAGIDLQCIMKEFVMPRLPNGYTIKIQEKSTERKSSVFKIIHDEEGDFIRPMKPKTFQHIKDVLISTNSPRPLHPKVVIKRPMQLIERPLLTENVGGAENSYMFSKLLIDLDELCDKQIPYVEKQIEEISEILSHVSASVEQNEESSDASEKNYSEISFMKTEDYLWNLNKKDVIEEHVGGEGVEDEESEDESIDLYTEEECVR